jgi:transcriptional regulator
MYVPDHFRPSDEHASWQVISDHGFGSLVTVENGEPPVASPLPFLACREEGELLGHLARANRQFKALCRAGSPTVLVMFQGPSGFVSGAYYDDPSAVPTWDHVTVHVTGELQLLPGEAETLSVLRDTVAHFEARAGSSWRLDVERADLPEMVRQVSAFRVIVHRIDAIFKLSQNIDTTRRRRVVAGLRAHGHAELVAAIEAEQRHLGLGAVS